LGWNSGAAHIPNSAPGPAPLGWNLPTGGPGPAQGWSTGAAETPAGGGPGPAPWTFGAANSPVGSPEPGPLGGGLPNS